MMGDRTRKLAFSLGYSGMAGLLPDVLKALAGKGATLVLDVRLRPTSPYPGYRRAAIKAACEHAGLHYIHAKDLGNPFFKDREQGLQRFEQHYLARCEAIELVLQEHIAQHVPIVLCGCVEHDRCHRSVYTRVMRRDGWDVDVVDRSFIARIQ